jgi:hypothetical protein
VVHEVGSPSHGQAGCAEEQQKSCGDDGEEDAIHGSQLGDRDIVPLAMGGDHFAVETAGMD